MKIIHCADIHLESKLKTNLTTTQAKERREEILLTFERMVDFAKNNQVDAILIAGDLFDTGNVTMKTRNKIELCIKEHKEIAFFYLKGNHDVDNFTSGMEELPENLHLFSNQWKTYMFQEITISGVEITAKNINKIYEELVLDPEQFNVVMLHGQEANYIGKDQTEVIKIPALANKFIDYLALGHIHMRKKGNIDTRGVFCYPGCLEGRGYDESGEKGFELLEIEQGHIKTTFVPFASRTIHEIIIDITGTETTHAIDSRISEKLDTIPQKDMVKVVLSGKVPVYAERDMVYLDTKYKNRFYSYKIEDDQVRLQLNPKDYESDASLKGEFIRLLMGKGFEEEKESAIIELGLKVLAGEDVDR